jgi:hypothetical protein
VPFVAFPYFGPNALNLYAFFPFFALFPAGFKLDLPQPFFLQEQRNDLVQEFVHAMHSKETLSKFGVLLSGPNGVGKSAVGVHAFAACFAQGLPVVYIPSASAWVAAAQLGAGDQFFFRHLLLQSADLIIAEPALREALASVLVGGAITGATMTALLDALLDGPTVGVIVDEVQKITEALARGATHSATSQAKQASDYFLQWQNWDNGSMQRLTRMDIASSHGARELKLPSGEGHRLRIVKPWTADVLAAATRSEKSPMFFNPEDQRARDRIIFIAGGIPRTIFQGLSLLEQKRAAGMKPALALADVEVQLKEEMRDCCKRWFGSLSQAEKADAAAALLPLIRGEVRWSRVKGLYDDGLVARCGESECVTPVSAVAASVICATLAEHYRATGLRPLSSIHEADARGNELERQTLALLERVDRNLPAKQLDASAAAPVRAHTVQAMSFKTIHADIKADDTLATLYIPQSDQYRCDGITVPATSSPSEPVVVWETSVTDPREPKRVDKCLKWFDDGEFLSKLKAFFPTRKIVIALCWNDNFARSDDRHKYKELTDAAARMDITVAVVDAVGLQQLGVVL